MPPKVLISIVTASIKDYCLKEFAENVKTFTYPNKEIMVIDNSDDDQHYLKIQELLPEATVIDYAKGKNETIREAMAAGNNLCREYAIQSKADFMLSLESDIFPRPDVIEQLLSHKKLVVGLPYFIGSGCHSKYINYPAGGYGSDKLAKQMNLDEAFLFTDGNINTGFNFGIGCVLIARYVFEKIKFRIGDPSDMYPDSFFHTDLKANHIQAYIDTSYIARHLNTNTWV